MAALQSWFIALSLREKILIAVGSVLLLFVVAVYGLYLPLEQQLTDARRDAREALERKERIGVKVAAIRAHKPVAKVRMDGPLDAFVSQSAGELGITFQKNDAANANMVRLTIASARGTALLGWLSDLEKQGVKATAISLTPAGSDVVSATLTLERDR